MTSIFNTHYSDNLTRVNSRSSEPKSESAESKKGAPQFSRVLADLEHHETPANVAKTEGKAPSAASVVTLDHSGVEFSNLTPTEMQQDGITSTPKPPLTRFVKAYSNDMLCPTVKAESPAVKPLAPEVAPGRPVPVVNDKPRPPAAPELMGANRREERPRSAELAEIMPKVTGLPAAPDMLGANWTEDDDPALAIISGLPKLNEGQLASGAGLARSRFEPKPREDIGDIRAIIEKAGRRHGIDPHLSMAVAQAESDFRVHATSQDGHGSKGLFQLLDSTGKHMMSRIGVQGPYQPFDAQQNATLGVGYLRRLHDIFSTETNLGSNMKTVPATSADDLEKIAIAAFNAGEGNVAKAQAKARAIGRDPSDYDSIEPFLPASTRSYVKKVSNLRTAYALTDTAKRRV